jgi:hypothetical protein
MSDSPSADKSDERVWVGDPDEPGSAAPAPGYIDLHDV